MNIIGDKLLEDVKMLNDYQFDRFKRYVLVQEKLRILKRNYIAEAGACNYEKMKVICKSIAELTGVSTWILDGGKEELRDWDVSGDNEFKNWVREDLNFCRLVTISKIWYSIYEVKFGKLITINGIIPSESKTFPTLEEAKKYCDEKFKSLGYKKYVQPIR